VWLAWFVKAKTGLKEFESVLRKPNSAEGNRVWNARAEGVSMEFKAEDCIEATDDLNRRSIYSVENGCAKNMQVIGTPRKNA
jgi:hypothetical protein